MKNLKHSIATLALVAAMVVPGPGCQLPGPRTPSSPAETAAMSTVKVNVHTVWGTGSGTGWYVASNLIMTAGHVCQNPAASVFGIPGPVTYDITDDRGETHGAKIVLDLGGDGDDPVAAGDVDICVMEVEGPKGRPLPLGSTANLRFGSPAAYAGYPAGMRAWYEGTFGARDDDSDAIVFSVPAWYGASGSAILDSSGRVLGVLVQAGNAAGTQVIAVPVEYVRKALKAAVDLRESQASLKTAAGV